MSIRPRQQWVPALLTALVFFLGACTTVPHTGRSQLLLLSEPDEIKMGAKAYRDILAKEKISSDSKLNALVRRVGRRIAGATGRDDYQWEFKVVENDKMINAFALPGGKVAVYTGILPVTQDEAGLAAVMGHEVAHATARHGGERVSRGLLVQIGLTAVMIALNDRNSPTTRNVIALLGAGATVGIILPFGRAQESEADRLGLIYMARAGYDPRAAKGFWTRMKEASQGKQPPEFLSTHPSHDTRIKDIEGWLPEAMKHYKAAGSQN